MIVVQKPTLPSWLLCSLLFLLWFPRRASALVVSNTTEIKEGIVRYHYENEAEYFCSSVLMIGVGTAMKVGDYDLLATEIARGRQGVIVVMLDHSPGNPLKLSTKRYAILVNAIAARTDELVSICRRNRKAATRSSQRTKFFLGGHSASGMVAIKALPLIEGFQLAGVVGLSPFRITDKMMRISIPSLFWGFSTTTCGVVVGNAADQAYENSLGHRVLYQLQNPSGHPSHCIFANHGCLPVCPCSNLVDHAWIRPAVGESIHHFLHAIESNNFTRPSLQLSLPQETTGKYLQMFVNRDEVPMPNGFSPGDAVSA